MVKLKLFRLKGTQSQILLLKLFSGIQMRIMTKSGTQAQKEASVLLL